jgi:hypothetical protein
MCPGPVLHARNARTPRLRARYARVPVLHARNARTPRVACP